MDPSHKQNYGPLGELTREEWKRCLESNEGLFARIERELPDVFPGPVLNREGEVRGDFGGGEVMYFIQHSTSEQDNFLVKLLEYNLAAAHEYIITMIGLHERWQQDIRWLRIALHYFKEEEHKLQEDERRLLQGENPLPLHFSEALKRHYPEHFRDIDFGGLAPTEALALVERTLAGVSKKEANLEKYLEETKKVLPFLFED